MAFGRLLNKWNEIMNDDTASPNERLKAELKYKEIQDKILEISKRTE